MHNPLVLIGPLTFVGGIVVASIVIAAGRRRRERTRPHGAIYAGHAAIPLRDVSGWHGFGAPVIKARWHRMLGVLQLEGIATIRVDSIEFRPSRMSRADGMTSVTIPMSEILSINKGEAERAHVHLELQTSRGLVVLWVQERYLNDALVQLSAAGVNLRNA